MKRSSGLNFFFSSSAVCLWFDGVVGVVVMVDDGVVVVVVGQEGVQRDRRGEIRMIRRCCWVYTHIID